MAAAPVLQLLGILCLIKASFNTVYELPYVMARTSRDLAYFILKCTILPSVFKEGVMLKIRPLMMRLLVPSCK